MPQMLGPAAAGRSGRVAVVSDAVEGVACRHPRRPLLAALPRTSPARGRRLRGDSMCERSRGRRAGSVPSAPCLAPAGSGWGPRSRFSPAVLGVWIASRRGPGCPSPAISGAERGVLHTGHVCVFSGRAAGDVLGPLSVSLSWSYGQGQATHHAGRPQLLRLSRRWPRGGSRMSRRVDPGPGRQRDRVYTEWGRSCFFFHFLFCVSSLQSDLFTTQNFAERAETCVEWKSCVRRRWVPARTPRSPSSPPGWPPCGQLAGAGRRLPCPPGIVLWIWPAAAARRRLARLRPALRLPGAATGRSGEGPGWAAAASASQPPSLKEPWGRVHLRLAITQDVTV